MEVIATAIPDVKILQPRLFEDSRGYFFESFNDAVFSSKVAPITFVQDNESLSQKNVVRGLHFQIAEAAQTKLIRAVRGSIWDVAVDLRKESPTFKKWVGVEISEENKRQLFVPKGFAHGFIAISETAIVQYKVDRLYSPGHDRGIRFDDPELAIAWPLSGPAILSPKDEALPLLRAAELFG